MNFKGIRMSVLQKGEAEGGSRTVEGFATPVTFYNDVPTEMIGGWSV